MPASATLVTRAEARVARFYQPELDALRFSAFFGVFLFHAAPRTAGFYAANGVPAWLSGFLISAFGAGAYGVDLFFALSAYLITSLLLRERAAEGKVELRSFYLRRILRIWPLYLAFVAFAALAQFVLPAQKLPWQYVAGFALLAGNWIYVFRGLPASFAIPLWTVSIEEQFYLAWPLALRRASPRHMAAIAIGVLVIGNVCRIGLAAFGGSANAIEYSTLTRLDPIALGILLAIAGDRLPNLVRWQRITLLFAGVVSWIAAYAFSVADHPDDLNLWRLALAHPVISLGAAAVLLAVLGSQNGFLRSKPLLYLGKISYGLYVVHEFAHYCVSRVLPASTPGSVLAQAVASLMLTVLLAASSYRWLESPFLRLKERFTRIPSRPV